MRFVSLLVCIFTFVCHCAQAGVKLTPEYSLGLALIESRDFTKGDQRPRFANDFLHSAVDVGLHLLAPVSQHVDFGLGLYAAIRPDTGLGGSRSLLGVEVIKVRQRLSPAFSLHYAAGITKYFRTPRAYGPMLGLGLSYQRLDESYEVTVRHTEPESDYKTNISNTTSWVNVLSFSYRFKFK